MEGTRKMLFAENMSDVATTPKESIQNFGEFLLEKLHQLLHILPQMWSLWVERINQILPPPETLHRWTHVGLTIALPIALSFLFLHCFLLCCRFCCSGRRGPKMVTNPITPEAENLQDDEAKIPLLK